MLLEYLVKDLQSFILHLYSYTKNEPISSKQFDIYEEAKKYDLNRRVVSAIFKSDVFDIKYLAGNARKFYTHYKWNSIELDNIDSSEKIIEFKKLISTIETNLLIIIKDFNNVQNLKRNNGTGKIDKQEFKYFEFLSALKDKQILNKKLINTIAKSYNVLIPNISFILSSLNIIVQIDDEYLWNDSVDPENENTISTLIDEIYVTSKRKKFEEFYNILDLNFRTEDNDIILNDIMNELGLSRFYAKIIDSNVLDKSKLPFYILNNNINSVDDLLREIAISKFNKIIPTQAKYKEYEIDVEFEDYNNKQLRFISELVKDSDQQNRIFSLFVYLERRRKSTFSLREMLNKLNIAQTFYDSMIEYNLTLTEVPIVETKIGKYYEYYFTKIPRKLLVSYIENIFKVELKAKDFYKVTNFIEAFFLNFYKNFTALEFSMKTYLNEPQLYKLKQLNPNLNDAQVRNLDHKYKLVILYYLLKKDYVKFVNKQLNFEYLTFKFNVGINIREKITDLVSNPDNYKGMMKTINANIEEPIGNIMKKIQEESRFNDDSTVNEKNLNEILKEMRLFLQSKKSPKESTMEYFKNKFDKYFNTYKFTSLGNAENVNKFRDFVYNSLIGQRRALSTKGEFVLIAWDASRYTKGVIRKDEMLTLEYVGNLISDFRKQSKLTNENVYILSYANFINI